MKFLIIFCLAAVAVHAQFNAAAQKEIVDGINYLRSRVASGTYRINERTLPAASDMLKVTWNSTLAVAAQKLANTCLISVESSVPGIADKRVVPENVNSVAKNALKKEIVTYINDLRSLVASGRFHLDSRDVETLPPASDMLKVTWNSTLAVEAQKLAKTCFIGVESSSPGIADKRIVAANLDMVAKNALGHWKHSLNKEWNLKSYNSNYIGIQLIWAKSSSVGCGFSPCEVDSQGRRWYKVVCSFEEKGGITREPVYKEGRACEACPAGTKCASGSVLCS